MWGDGPGGATEAVGQGVLRTARFQWLIFKKNGAGKGRGGCWGWLFGLNFSTKTRSEKPPPASAMAGAGGGFSASFSLQKPGPKNHPRHQPAETHPKKAGVESPKSVFFKAADSPGHGARRRAVKEGRRGGGRCRGRAGWRSGKLKVGLLSRPPEGVGCNGSTWSPANVAYRTGAAVSGKTGRAGGMARFFLFVAA